MKLPVYKLVIDEEDFQSGVDFISLVENPAIQKDFLKFNQQFVQPGPTETQDEFIQRCVKYVIDEGKDSEQAVAICYSLWENKSFAEGEKVSFDFDDTLNTARGKELATNEIDSGSIVYIISARSDKESMFSVADELGIPHDRIYATGSNKLKVEKVKELGIQKHYDNNADVISELGSIGAKFNQVAQFAIQNEEKRIITGPAMLADLPIYRRDEQRGEYYVVFDKETIFKIAKKWAIRNKYNSVNVDHAQVIDGLTLLETYFIDKERGIVPPIGFEDAKDGSWFVSYYVENDKVWSLIKEGVWKGFSVEGFFDFVEPKTQEDEMLEAIMSMLQKWNGQ